MSDVNREEDPRDDATASMVFAGVLGGALTLGALGIYGTKTAASVALGAGIAVANLWTMRAIVRALVPSSASPDDAAGGPADVPGGSSGSSGSSGEDAGEKDEKDGPDHHSAGRRGGAAWAVFAVLKILILFGGIWLLLTKGLVAPIPLVVGYGVLPLGIAAASLWGSLRPRPPERRQ